MILGKELKTIWILWLLLVNPTPGEAKPPVAEKHQRSFFCIMATSGHIILDIQLKNLLEEFDNFKELTESYDVMAKHNASAPTLTLFK
jgi:hypothetical protein